MRARFGMAMVAALLATPGQAQMPTDEERIAYLAYVVAAARVDGDPLSDAAMLGLLAFQKNLAEAADIAPGDQSPEEISLRAEADVLHARLSERIRGALPDDPYLLARDLGCSAEAATPGLCTERRSRLFELAGDNAYPYLELAASAWRTGDAQAYLAYMGAAAAAGRYRSPYSDSYRALRSRLKQVPDDVAPDFGNEDGRMRRAENMAMLLAGAHALPSVQGFSGPCREAEGELRTHCLAIAMQQLADAHTVFEVGVAAGVILALGDDGERQQAEQKRRDAYWQIEATAALHQAAERGQVPAGYDAYFDDYGEVGELEAGRRLLEANGRATVPPEGWASGFAP